MLNYRKNLKPIISSTMKKLLIFSNILFIGIIVFQSCNKNNSSAADCGICKDYTGYPAQELEVNMLKAMSKNFDTTSSTFSRMLNYRVVRNNMGLGQDTRSIWFNLDSLKNFIWQVESNACKAGCSKSTQNLNLGLRLYYGRYPFRNYIQSHGLTRLMGLNPSYENMHTIFMVPTYYDGTDNKDFDPRYFSSKNGQCVFDGVGDHLKQMVMMPLAAALATNHTSTAMNHGGLCPPLSCGGSAY